MEAASSSGGRDLPERRFAAVPASPSGTDVAVSDGGGGSGKDDPKVVLDVLVRLAGQELDRSERYSNRARQAFAFSAAFFALVQTVAFSSFSADLVSAHERKTLLILAIVAGSVLVSCGFALLITDAKWKTRDLDSDEVMSVANSAAEEDEPVAIGFSSLYATVLDERRATNGRRHVALRSTQILALVSVLAVLAELIFALNARIG